MSTCSPASNLNNVPTLPGISTTDPSLPQGQGTFVFLSTTPLCGATVGSFYPTLYLCYSILHILIAAWPLTLTVSNGIARVGHRPRSRSCKCTAHVCANSPIDASLAPVSGRKKPSCDFCQNFISICERSWNPAETKQSGEFLYIFCLESQNFVKTGLVQGVNALWRWFLMYF